MLDLFNELLFTKAEPPVAARTDNTAIISEILDTANFGSALMLIQLGTNTDVDATFVVLFEDGNNSALSDNAPVVDAELFGTEAGAAFLFSDDDKTVKIGYNGAKRYIRVTITPSGNDSGNIFLSMTWIQGHSRKGPQSTQIV